MCNNHIRNVELQSSHHVYSAPIAIIQQTNDNINHKHSYDILGARMLWKPKEARILKNFKKIYRSTSVIW
jgi:hypothetical protein